MSLIKQPMGYKINVLEGVITGKIVAIRTMRISLNLFRLFTFRNIGFAYQISCAVQQMLHLYMIVHMP